jgi:type III pantothenate kinase
VILAIDAGNTRIKWGLWEDRGFVAQGSVLTARAAELADALHMLARPDAAIGSSVAGASVKAQIEQVLVPWGVALRWIAAATSECGVTNGYAEPSQLGADRWAALIAAHARFAGPCLVVNAGTAITIDALAGDGRFLGGLILPGIELMASALARGTAGLAQQSGRFEAFPTGTGNAIYSGALQAACGAIERMQRGMQAAGHEQPRVVLSGGAAHVLTPLLEQAPALAPSLVLEGLIEIARA